MLVSYQWKKEINLDKLVNYKGRFNVHLKLCKNPFSCAW